MNEFVLVEFIATNETDLITLKDKVIELGSDYQHIDDDHEYDEDTNTNIFQQWYILSGRINSMRASLIKLQDPFLADRMRISHIPEELKNKYRK
jgi:hypothetical protein